MGQFGNFYARGKAIIQGSMGGEIKQETVLTLAYIKGMSMIWIDSLVLFW